MSLRSLAEVGRRLDRLLGKAEALAAAIEDQGRKLGALGERVAQLEQGVKATKEVVEAFTAAKRSMRFLKWSAGLIASLAGLAAAMRGWLQK